MASEQNNGAESKRIDVFQDGPYILNGNIAVVRKVQVVSEHGEPVAWKKGPDIAMQPGDALCRCGHSHTKPICDGTHCEIGFDGTETADPGTTAERQVQLPGGKQLIVMRDYSICMESGFCGNRFETVETLLDKIDDPGALSQVIAMIERCPSGSYTYRFQADAADNEPDLPQQVAVVTEMTDQGPIMGPLWVTGNIPVQRADGQPLETRNRVTLCRCGLSNNKPLCDGEHRRQCVRED